MTAVDSDGTTDVAFSDRDGQRWFSYRACGGRRFWPRIKPGCCPRATLRSHLPLTRGIVGNPDTIRASALIDRGSGRELNGR